MPQCRLACLSLAVVALAGCSSSGQSAAPTVVTPDDALKVANQQVSAMLNASDPGAVDQGGEDPFASIQKASIQVNTNLHQPNAADVTPSNIKVSVPRQTSYPAQFLATFIVTSPTLKITDQHEMALFVLRSKGAEWKVHGLYPLDAGTPPPDLKADGAYVGVPQGSSGARVDPATVCAKTATMMAASATGADPTANPELKPVDLGTGMSNQLAFIKSRAATADSQGVAKTDEFAADDSLVAAFNTGAAEILQLCTVNETFRETAAAGKVFVQGDDRKNLGPLLAPGAFQALTYHASYTIAVQNPAGKAQNLGARSAAVKFIGLSGFNTSATPT